MPFTLAATLWFNAVIAAFRGDPSQTRHFADRCASLCATHGFAYWHSMACALQAWARVQDGQARAGICDLEAAQVAHGATGATLFRTYICAFLAEAHLRAGSHDDGLVAVDAGLAVAESTLDRSYWPELWRLKGELLLASSRGGSGRRSKADRRWLEARPCFERAVEVAQASQARALELRALTSLAATSTDAVASLQTVCDWFGADSHSPDLTAARTLLANALARSRPSRAR
jgi:hypothetical protein